MTVFLTKTLSSRHNTLKELDLEGVVSPEHASKKWENHKIEGKIVVTD